MNLGCSHTKARARHLACPTRVFAVCAPVSWLRHILQGDLFGTTVTTLPLHSMILRHPFLRSRIADGVDSFLLKKKDETDECRKRCATEFHREFCRKSLGLYSSCSSFQVPATKMKQPKWRGFRDFRQAAAETWIHYPSDPRKTIDFSTAAAAAAGLVTIFSSLSFLVLACPGLSCIGLRCPAHC